MISQTQKSDDALLTSSELNKRKRGGCCLVVFASLYLFLIFCCSIVFCGFGITCIATGNYALCHATSLETPVVILLFGIFLCVASFVFAILAVKYREAVFLGAKKIKEVVEFGA